MTAALSFRFTTQIQNDIGRITSELADLQRQMSSGAKHNDLQGYGGSASRLLTAQGLKANAQAQSSVINQLQARFGVQAAALGQVADASQLLAQTIREAISANDGRGIANDLQLSFASIVSSLNETWNGQPLFAGERQDGSPVQVGSLEELLAATTPEDLFDEAARHQTLDTGNGVPIVLAAKASDMSQGVFNAMRQLKLLLDETGGVIGQPISLDQQNRLQALANTLTAEAANFTNEEGRAGQLQKRFETDLIRLTERTDLLTKEIGEQADADAAEVSIKLSALLVQYEAAAKTFSELSRLSLLDYL